MDQTRRQFLRGKFLTHEGRDEVEQQQTPLGSLPPWHIGKLEQKDCIGCDQPCVESCEQKIILIHPQGHQFSGLPYLGFSHAGCTFCFACVEACPLELDADRNIKPDIGMAELDRTSCYAWNDVVCMSCRYSCDQQAIKFTAHKYPEINSAACNGCGQCIRVCPADALTVAALV
ncbi:MAG TPA: 4Fe-4S dicluster domain-containing protein [Chromatiales bacterium]|nr:4Fe-4S dicluster domain-containing protein [Thiotrichales bacterium]HIP68059.1 4Fe-4S dicluster domain-containing protein [Chromatiales bacterium]